MVARSFARVAPRQSRSSAILFDAPQVVALLENRAFQAYLADMLVSFVRIDSFSASVLVAHGVWSKVRFSDFDIDSLVRVGHALDESQRFPVYKRIADIFAKGDPLPEVPGCVAPRAGVLGWGQRQVHPLRHDDRRGHGDGQVHPAVAVSLAFDHFKLASDGS